MQSALRAPWRGSDLARCVSMVLLIAIAVSETGCTIQVSGAPPPVAGGPGPLGIPPAPGKGGELPPLPPLAPAAPGTTVASPTAPGSTQQAIVLNVLSASSAQVAGEASDPADPSGTPLSVSVFRASADPAAAALATGLANLDGSDIAGVTQRGRAFRLAVAGVQAGEQLVVKASSPTTAGRVQSSAPFAVQAPAAPGTTTAAAPGTTTAAAPGTSTAPGTAAPPAAAAAPPATAPVPDPLAGALGGLDPNALGGLTGGTNPGALPQPTDKDACFANQTLLQNALNAAETANPGVNYDGQSIQVLVPKYLAQVPDDPGQGAGSGARDYVIAGGVVGITCRVHGSNLANGNDPTTALADP